MLRRTMMTTGIIIMLHFFILLLEIIFFTGLAGSLVVAVMAFVGDIHVFFESDKEKEKEPSAAVVPSHAHSAQRS
jgi:hypothetical protein